MNEALARLPARTWRLEARSADGGGAAAPFSPARARTEENGEAGLSLPLGRRRLGDPGAAKGLELSSRWRLRLLLLVGLWVHSLLFSFNVSGCSCTSLPLRPSVAMSMGSRVGTQGCLLAEGSQSLDLMPIGTDGRSSRQELQSSATSFTRERRATTSARASPTSLRPLATGGTPVVGHWPHRRRARRLWPGSADALRPPGPCP